VDLKQYLKEKKSLIDNYLTSYISQHKSNSDCPKELIEAMGYALMAGGKRLRPILAIASYEASGGDSEDIIPIAASLELIHTYSLIHDDLPAIDNDDFRRNKPTTHRVFGEAIAILAGDALLTDAFRVISGSTLDPSILVKVIHEISQACGPGGMVGGQTMDIMLEGKDAVEKEVNYIHTHKTGAFIRASVRIGAIMASAEDRYLDALSIYGERIGLAFQIMDDVLDITGSDEELGKKTGVDQQRGKVTYPSVLGLDDSIAIARRLIDEAIEVLKVFDHKADPLREIARYIISRRN